MIVMSELRSILRSSVDSGRVTVIQLAAAGNVSRTHIYKLLNGDSEPTVSLAEKLMRACGAQLEIKKLSRKSRSA